MTYQEAIEWLEGVSLYGKKDGLTNMRQLMEELGNPEEHIRFVHVAGTNGKGTVCALLSSMLTESGYRVGVYTSPHLVRYTERIRIAQTEIPEKTFAALADQVREKAEKMEREGKIHPTFFQLLTAIAFLYFAREKADIVVLEVGVGGRLDATNIIRQPLVSVITSISLDHTKVLGSTIPEIAGEKAGIIKQGCPVVVGRNVPEAMEVFYAAAKEKAAPLYEADPYPVRVLQNDLDGIRLETEEGELRTALCGEYQVENLKTALTAARTLSIPWKDIAAGVNKAYWPGRMQRIHYTEHADLLLEGAHNPQGAEALGQWCREKLNGKDVTLVFSALQKKDVASIVRGLLIGIDPKRMIFARMQETAGLQEADFLRIVPEAGTASNVREALKQAYRQTAPDGLVICAGSLYLVGEVLAEVEREEKNV